MNIAIRNTFSKAKHLLDPYWREKNEKSGIDSTGFCHMASEAYFSLTGGKSKYIAMRAKDSNGDPHIWLRCKATNEIIDLTADQYPDGFDYSNGKAVPFRSTSNKTKAFIRLMQGENADNPYIPNRLKHLPVYYWIDVHDENEWIMDDGEGGLWHMVGNAVTEMLKEQEL